MKTQQKINTTIKRTMIAITTIITLLLLITAMTITGCTPNGIETIRDDNNTKPTLDYRIVMIDECEYIEVNNGVVDGRVYSLTHKGDCKNTIHPEHTRR